MDWDVIDSASQAVRRMEIWTIGSGVRVGFKSGRTSSFGRKGVSSSSSRLSSNLGRDIGHRIGCWRRCVLVSKGDSCRKQFATYGWLRSSASGGGKRKGSVNVTTSLRKDRTS
jgi:hypothetical protein